jgi:zinc protease
MFTPATRRLAAMVISIPFVACCWGTKNVQTSGSTEAEPPAWPAMPVPGDAVAWEAPAASTFTLANGIEVTFIQTGAVPLTYVQLNLHRGHHSEPLDKVGISSLTADMLNEGAGDRDALALDEALRLLASRVSLGAGGVYSYARIESLETHLDATLALAADIVRRPTFAQADLDRVRQDTNNRLLTEKDDLRTTGSKVFYRTLFGEEAPGRWSRGSAESLAGITTDDLKALHQAVWRPDNAAFVVVSRQNQATIQAALDKHFGDWTAPEGVDVAAPPAVATAHAEGITVYWVDHPGASQSALYVGNSAGAFDADKAAARSVSNMVLGGQFTSRLNMNLREDKGYTYGARTSRGASLVGGWFVGSTSVKAGTTALALTEVLSEFSAAVGERGITETEFSNARGTLLQGRPARFERMSGVLGQYASAEGRKRPAGWVVGYRARVDAVTLEAAQAELAGALDPSNLAILIVGDRTAAAQTADGEDAEMTIEAAVAAMGLGDLVWLDHEGAPIEGEK